MAIVNGIKKIDKSPPLEGDKEQYCSVPPTPSSKGV